MKNKEQMPEPQPNSELKADVLPSALLAQNPLLCAVTYYDFCKKVCEDLGIELSKKNKMYFMQFPFKNGKRKINSFSDSVIVDKKGNEYPYMISQAPAIRNEERLIDFDYLYTIRSKGLEQIIQETGIKLKSEKCRICEGGGWYSNGTKYFYKDIYCEV